MIQEDIKPEQCILELYNKNKLEGLQKELELLFCKVSDKYEKIQIQKVQSRHRNKYGTF